VAYERLTRTAAHFLAWEDVPGSWHIGGLLLIEPREDGKEIDLAVIRAHVAARVGIDPQLRQRLARPPYGIGPPVWVDDADFDLDDHVLALEADGPVDEARLRDLVGELISKPLDLRRPLWSMHVVTSLEDGGTAIISRFHHSIADGMKGVALAAGMLLDTAPDAPPEPPAEWTPRPDPSDRELLLDWIRTRVADTGAALAGTARSFPRRARGLVRIPDPAFAGRAWETVRRAPGTLRREWLGSPPRSPLEGKLGERRAVAMTSRDLDEVKGLERAFGRKVTVNDICLSALAGGLAAWMPREKLAVQDIVVKIPVVPHTQEGGMAKRTGFGSTEFVPLPVAEPDPVTRLLEVSARTHDVLRQADVTETRTIEEALARFPQALAKLAEDRLEAPGRFNLAVTNVPGPPNPFYVAGGRARVAIPLPHLWGNHLLHVGILSLSGTLTLALVADPEHLPEPQAIADAAGEELAALLARA
jgi:diacylglycerol O-acyltransferase